MSGNDRKDMGKQSYKYLFGPVPSRRFGLSLGVDLVPRKTCTLDCVFCEVGRTDRLTVERREYAPVAEIERELEDWRAGGGRADVIAVTGSGEPTLHTGFGNVLDFINRRIGIKSILMTNSTLIYLPEVRRAAALAGAVKATLTAWDENSFRRITRPHGGVSFGRLLEGLREFRGEYAGELWLEVFIVPGVNSAPEDVRRIAELARSVKPDKIQLNTAVRPAADGAVAPVAAGAMAELAALFDPPAEVIASFSGRHNAPGDAEADLAGRVLAMLRRRPCTELDVAASFGISRSAAGTVLKSLSAEGAIVSERHGRDVYFMGESRGRKRRPEGE